MGKSASQTLMSSRLTYLPTQHMLFTLHRDMPGIIGKLGSLLGSFNVNIASMQVGRKIVRGDAVMVLSLDDPLPDGILDEIIKVPGDSGCLHSDFVVGRS